MEIEFTGQVKPLDVEGVKVEPSKAVSSPQRKRTEYTVNPVPVVKRMAGSDMQDSLKPFRVFQD